jgi:hypothetical protein
MANFKLNGEVLTDASLKVSVSPELIAESQRTADGTLKTDYVATKRRFVFTWECLQSGVIGTAKGRDWLVGQHAAGTPVSLEVAKQGGSTDTYTVQFISYEEEALFVLATGWYYSVQLELEEV